MVGAAPSPNGSDAPRRRAPFAAFFSHESPAKGDGLMKGGDGWASNGGSSDADGEMIWNESIADALGYGKNGRPGAAFQWWIPAVATLTCVGSFVAWAVLAMRGRDATEEAMRVVGVDFPWWDDIKALLVVTAVLYPVFVALALVVTAWRAYLAKTLDIHRPDAKWLASCRRFQWVSAAAHTVLWLLVLLIVFSVAGHAVWGYLTRMADVVGGRVIDLVGPVWSSVSKVASSSKELTDRFTGMLNSLPSIGRKLMEDGGAAGVGAGGAATVGSLLSVAGTMGGGRHLQQTSPLLDTLGQLAKGIAQGISAAASAIPATIPGVPENVTIPGLPTLLPNGSSNPLVGAITDVAKTVESQIFNPNGCPIYCIDLRKETWWVDSSAGCFCDLDRLEDALPHLRRAWQAVIPSVLALIFMYIGASWLLMHGAAQWARTRSEAKLMQRIPGAAAAARVAVAQQQGAVADGKLEPAPGPVV